MSIIDKLYDNFFNVSTVIDEKESSSERDIYTNYVPTSYYFLEKLFTFFPFDT